MSTPNTCNLKAETCLLLAGLLRSSLRARQEARAFPVVAELQLRHPVVGPGPSTMVLDPPALLFVLALPRLGRVQEVA